MDSLPAEVYSAASVRAMDRHAIERSGIPGYSLMQRAGSAAFDAVRRHWPAASRVALICGAGNNAGDGYVFARRARAAGLGLSVAALADPERLRGDAARAFADFAADGGLASEFHRASFDGADLVVDALLGTGVDRPVDGAYRACIERVNRMALPVLALDMPSGLDADSGLPRGAAICATRTLAFIALKSGHFLGSAPDHVGALDFAGLDVPDGVRAAEAPVLRRMAAGLAAAALPPRRRSAHKGEHGRVLVIGGNRMAGAASAGSIVAARPELIASSIATASDRSRLLEAADAVAIGPGLGTDRGAQHAFDAAVAAGRPLVVDADALGILAARPRRRADWILTPHPGEAARLLGTDAASVQRDRLGTVRAIAERFGGVCVLKGAHTLVLGPDPPAWVCDRGNPGMATAGSGDVLTGVVAALLAGGCAPALAAAAGVLLHAEAGDRAARRGVRGLIAGDMVAELRGVVNAPWT